MRGAFPEHISKQGGERDRFGNKVLLAGYYYNGRNANSYFAAVYEHTNDDLSIEGEIKLTAVSEEFFEDNGRLTTNTILISHSRLNEAFYDHTAMTLRNTQKAVGIMISDDCDLWIYPTKTYIMLGKEKNVRSLKLPYH